jgi:hypothetical protein
MSHRHSDIASHGRGPETQGVQRMEGHWKTWSATHLDLGDTEDHRVGPLTKP